MQNLWWYPGSKNKSFGLALLFLALTLVAIYSAQAIPAPGCNCFAWLFFFLTLGYGAIWLFKRDTDKRLAANALQQRVVEPIDIYRSSGGYGERAPKTTPGSGFIGLDDLQPPESA